MSPQVDVQLQTMINNMPEKTGKPLEAWFKILAASKLEKHGEMLKLLKGEYGLTHGFANTIALLYREQAAGGPPQEEDLVAAQYAGAKAGLRPVYDAVLKATSALGSDVEIAPKKTYVSLRRKKQFAIIQASAKDRIDLGLNLKDIDATGRLESGTVFSGMCTHRVRLSSPGEVDNQVREWLRLAYEQA